MIDKNIKYAELDANALTFDFDICLPNPVISRIFFFINRSFCGASLRGLFRKSFLTDILYKRTPKFLLR